MRALPPGVPAGHLGRQPPRGGDGHCDERADRGGLTNVCHCEERSDEAISTNRGFAARDCFASLAMTPSLARPFFCLGKAIFVSAGHVPMNAASTPAQAKANTLVLVGCGQMGSEMLRGWLARGED